MALTSRKKRPLDRSQGLVRDAKLIVIASEGEKTEGQYFNLFHNVKVKIHVIGAQDGKSSPEYVLARLEEFSNTYQLDEGDELWLMVDIDRWGIKKLSRVCQECSQKGYGLAVSNPCFEVWLFLHIGSFAEPLPNTCKEVKQLLRAALGSYSSSNLNIEAFKDHVPQAIMRAKSLDLNPSERYPSDFGTHVYRIAEQLI